MVPWSFFLLYCKQCIGNKNTYMGNYTILMKIQNLSCFPAFSNIRLLIPFPWIVSSFFLFFNLQSYSNLFFVQDMGIYRTGNFLALRCSIKSWKPYRMKCGSFFKLFYNHSSMCKSVNNYCHCCDWYFIDNWSWLYRLFDIFHWVFIKF